MAYSEEQAQYRTPADRGGAIRVGRPALGLGQADLGVRAASIASGSPELNYAGRRPNRLVLPTPYALGLKVEISEALD